MQEVSALYVAASLTSDVAAMIQPFKNIRLSPLKFGFCEVVLKSLKHYRQEKKARPSFVNAFNYFDRFRIETFFTSFPVFVYTFKMPFISSIWLKTTQTVGMFSLKN
jgi:hypothetical protein